MYWVDNGTGVTTPPTIPPVQSSVRQYFTEGGQSLQPTIPGGEWFNMVTDELLSVLTAAGVLPEKLDHNQLLKSLNKLYLAKTNIGNGTGQIPDMSFFGSTQDVFKLPSGDMVICGSFQATIPAGNSGAASTQSVTFPVPFPVSCRLVTGSFTNGVGSGAIYHTCESKSQQGFILRAGVYVPSMNTAQIQAVFNYLAIGKYL